MNLDSKTKGLLGMQTNGGVWHRIALYDTKRRRGPSKPRRKPAVWEGEKVEAKPAALTRWHAVCETATGKDRAFVRDAASKAEFDRLASHHCDRQGWVFLWSKPAVLMGA